MTIDQDIDDARIQTAGELAAQKPREGIAAAVDRIRHQPPQLRAVSLVILQTELFPPHTPVDLLLHADPVILHHKTGHRAGPDTVDMLKIRIRHGQCAGANDTLEEHHLVKTAVHTGSGHNAPDVRGKGKGIRVCIIIKRTNAHMVPEQRPGLLFPVIDRSGEVTVDRLQSIKALLPDQHQQKLLI